MKKVILMLSILSISPLLWGVETLSPRTIPSSFQLPLPQEPLQNEEGAVAENPKSTKDKLIDVAYDYIGMKYAFGAAKGGAKTDCSLFSQRVFSKFGVSLPRSASEQSTVGKKIAFSNIQPGDLLFYRTYKKAPSHVAIYIGNGKIIHASFRQRRVTVDSISLPYYQKRFLFAKRVALKKAV
jgi:cell wall-associated NlpC family hydrolase